MSVPWNLWVEAGEYIFRKIRWIHKNKSVTIEYGIKYYT